MDLSSSSTKVSGATTKQMSLRFTEKHLQSVYQNSIRGFPGRAKVATFPEVSATSTGKCLVGVTKIMHQAKFWVNEEVYLTENGVLKGPFLVASFDENDRDYTLTEADGVTKWEGGKKVKEESLRRGKN